MNPAAQEFVPREKRTGDSTGMMPINRGLPQHQQHQQKPAATATKLRATAPAFVPKASSVLSTPLPLQPTSFLPPPLMGVPSAPTPVSTTAVSAPAPTALSTSVSEQHVDPQAEPKNLLLRAEPYMPTNPKVAAKCPATALSPKGPAGVDAGEAAGNESPQKPQPDPQQKAEKPAETQTQTHTHAYPVPHPLDNFRQEGSLGSTSVTDDRSDTVLQQIDALVEVVENDFSGSTLPSIFGVTDVAKPPPAEPIKFNTIWALHADDHPTQLGSPLAYDPVLVQLVGDVECFWRLWRYLPPPSALQPPFTYHWFRSGIKPSWEHTRNKNGGTITIVLFDRDKPEQNNKQKMDDAFMTMVMACCTEALGENSTNLNGIMLRVRANKPTTVQIWTANSDQQKLKDIAKNVRELLEKIIGSKSLEKLEYFSHQQTHGGGAGSLAGRRKGKPTRITPDYTL